MMTWSDVMLPDFPEHINCLPHDTSDNSQQTPVVYHIYADYDRANPSSV
jgi:hypothetical protein